MLKPRMGLNASNRCWSDLETDPMPFVYHGFVPAGVGIMLLILGGRQLLQYWRKRQTRARFLK